MEESKADTKSLNASPKTWKTEGHCIFSENILVDETLKISEWE